MYQNHINRASPKPLKCAPALGNDLRGQSYTKFNSYAESLEETCARQGNMRRFSVMADLVHDRATHKSIRFTDVLQADVLLWIASQGPGWFPRCIVYSHTAGKLELFLRAVNQSGFAPIHEILKITTPQELFRTLNSDAMQSMLNTEIFWRSGGIQCLNLEELERVWGVHRA